MGASGEALNPDLGSQGRAPRGSEIQVELKEKWDLAARGGGVGNGECTWGG